MSKRQCSRVPKRNKKTFENQKSHEMGFYSQMQC